MKNLSLFSLLVMIGLVLFMGGCQKDEVTSLNKATKLRTTIDEKESLKVFQTFRREIDGFPNLSCIPETYWNPNEVQIQMMFHENYLDKRGCNQNYGTPIWGATLIERDSLGTIRITPTIDRVNKDRKYVFVSESSQAGDRSIFIPFDAWSGSLIENDPTDTLSDVFARGIKCPGFGGNMKKFRSRRFSWFSGEWGTGSGSDGWLNDIDWGDFGSSYTGPSGAPSTGLGGGGGSTNGSLSYYNPRGGYANCDHRLRTAEGCIEFYKESTGFDLPSFARPNLQERINTCGCYNAIAITSTNWELAQSDEKLKCLSCYTHYGSEFGQAWAALFDIIARMELPCNTNEQQVLDNAKNQALSNICNSAAVNEKLYPGKILKDYMNYIKDYSDTYYAPIPSLNWGNESLTKDFSSANVENTMDLLDLTIQDLSAIPRDKLCEQIKIAECLKPKAITEANTGISNAEKAQLLDFYNNTILIDPCTGDEIDKDEIFSGLCENNEMSLAGLDEALDGVDKIIIDTMSLAAHCPNFHCVYNYLLNSGNKLFCDKLYLNFEYDENITVNISGFNQPGGPEGTTTYSNGGKTINIGINKITCNNPLSIAGTLIHESIHASLFKEAKVKDPTITREDIIKTLRLNAKTTDFDHEVMAKKYVKLLAESLREADGKRFPVEYYMYLAWTGIQNAGYELGYLLDPWIGQYLKKHETLMSTPSNLCK